MKKIKLLLLPILLLGLIFVHTVKPVTAHEYNIVDLYGCLTESEWQLLETKAETISNRYQTDVVVVVTPTTGDLDLVDYADDYFDFHGYGLGNDQSGVILVIDMNNSEVYTSTKGFGIYAFTDYGIEALVDSYINYLRDGDFNNAIDTFLNGCDYYLEKAEAGKPIDDPYYDPTPVDPEPEPTLAEILSTNGIISTVGGFFTALFTALGIRGRNKTVHSKHQANTYLRSGSFNLNGSRDTYLYTHTSRSPRPKETSSSSHSGGSTTHVSHSGSTHGGGGRRGF